VYKDWGQYDKAVDHYKRSLQVAQTIGNRRGIGRTLNNVGMVFADWGRYDKAVEYYHKSLSISEEIGDRTMAGKTLNNLGLVYWDWGRYDQAVEYYEKSLKVAHEVGDRPGEGRIFNNLGLVYADWGQYDKAVEFYDKALAISREIGDRHMDGKTLNNLGLVYAHRGEYEAALNNYRQGLAIFEELKVPTKWPKNLVANLYLDKGDLARAEPLVREAGYWSTLGRFFLLSSNYRRSQEYYEKLQTHSEKNRNAGNLFTAYTGLGLAYEGMGKDEDALKYYRSAVQFTEELRSTLAPAQREKFFDVRINGFYRTAPYEGLARVLMKMEKPTDAFTSSEYTRARLFAEALTRLSDGRGSDVPASVFKEDKDLNDKLAALKKTRQSAYEKNDRLLIESLEPQIVDVEKKFRAHVEMLREKYPLFAATRYPQPMALAQTALKDDEWVLSYDVTDPGLIVYLTKGKSLVKALFKKTPRKEIDKLVRTFRNPLELKPGDNFSEKLEQFDFGAGKKLTDILLADILPRIPENTPLIVVPDDSLGVLPFEMLVLNAGGRVKSDRRLPYISGARFFGDRNPISYYQSVTALTLARTFAKKRHSGRDVLIMDDPVFEADDPRLKRMVQSERIQLQKSLPGNLMSVRNEIDITFDRLPLTARLGESLKKLDPAKTRRYTGLQASKSALFDSPLERYGSMVFATHGYFGKDLPGVMEPVLILTLVGQPKGKDGYFRMSEVMGLKISADMVALTACQTGLGRRLTGEGVMGMGRAFQYSGAKTALISLWTVEEKASVSLVESFFRNLKAGKPKLEALQLARNEIRKSGYDHPFFWAPFILVGEVR
jgi:CHAT domain-containing protein/Tfp pilus assembly protein PilF